MQMQLYNSLQIEVLWSFSEQFLLIINCNDQCLSVVKKTDFIPNRHIAFDTK